MLTRVNEEDPVKKTRNGPGAAARVRAHSGAAEEEGGTRDSQTVSHVDWHKSHTRQHAKKKTIQYQIVRIRK